MEKNNILNKESLKFALTADIPFSIEECGKILDLIRKYDFTLSKTDKGFIISNKTFYETIISVDDLISDRLEYILSEYSRLSMQLVERVRYVAVLESDVDKVRNVLGNINTMCYVEADPYKLVATDLINSYMNINTNESIHSDMYNKSFQNPELCQLTIDEVSNNIRNNIMNSQKDIVEGSYDNLKNLFTQINNKK